MLECLHRSYKFDEIRSIAWTSSKQLAISASSPANLWLDATCLQSRIWIDQLFCNGNLLIGAGLKGSNAKPCVWAWDSLVRHQLWSCQLSSDSGRPCFVAQVQVDGAVIIGLETGSIHLIRDGAEVFHIALAISIRHAKLVELKIPGSVPAMLIISAANDLKFVSLADFSPVEIPLSGIAVVETEGDLAAISTMDGLFSVYSITCLSDGPLFMIPFAKPSISAHFRLSESRFVVAFEDRLQIYRCNFTKA